MKNKNDKRGKSPANFYDRIAEMLNKAAIPQTITVEAEGVSPETFLATGITKRELYATVAMASLAHAVVTTPPSGGGRLRSDWARRVATQAAELAYYLDEALGEIERNGAVADRTLGLRAGCQLAQFGPLRRGRIRRRCAKGIPNGSRRDSCRPARCPQISRT